MIRMYGNVPASLLEKFFYLSGLFCFDFHEELLKGIELHFNKFSIYPNLKVELLRMSGWSYSQLNQWDKALLAYKEGVELAPNYVKLRQNYHTAKLTVLTELERLYNESSYPELKATAKALLKCDPESEKAAYYLSIAEDDTANSKEAERILKPLIDKKPLQSCYWHSYAIVLNHLNRNEEAREICTKGINWLSENGRDVESLLGLLDFLGGRKPADLRLINSINEDKQPNKKLSE